MCTTSIPFRAIPCHAIGRLIAFVHSCSNRRYIMAKQESVSQFQRFLFGIRYIFRKFFSSSHCGGHNCKWLISLHEACLSNYSFSPGHLSVTSPYVSASVIQNIFASFFSLSLFLRFSFSSSVRLFVVVVRCGYLCEELRESKRKQTNYCRGQWRRKHIIFASLRTLKSE